MVASATTRQARWALWPLLLALAAPLVAARTYRTGISPLNRVVELIGNLFNIPVLQQPEFQVYFLRFGLFVVFLAIAHYGLKTALGTGANANKTAGIIATVFALIAALFMPADWVTANGGVITAIFAAAIPLGVIGLAIWFCVTTLNTSTIGRIIAIVILLTLLSIIDVYEWALKLPIVLLVPAGLLSRGANMRGGR